MNTTYVARQPIFNRKDRRWVMNCYLEMGKATPIPLISNQTERHTD